MTTPKKKDIKKWCLVLSLTACVSNPKSITKQLVTVEGLGGLKYLASVYPQADNLNRHYSERLKAKTCITHSCGWDVVENGADCDLLITLDARTCTIGKSNKTFEKPEGVGIHYAFYQTKPLRGWPIKDAINIEVKNTNHGDLPKDTKDEVMKLIEGEMR